MKETPKHPMPFASIYEYEGDYWISFSGSPIGPAMNQTDAQTVLRWLRGIGSWGSSLEGLWRAFDWERQKAEQDKPVDGKG